MPIVYIERPLLNSWLCKRRQGNPTQDTILSKHSMILSFLQHVCMFSFLLYISKQSASFVREKGSGTLKEISFYGWKWFMNRSVRSLFPNVLFRNSIRGQSWKRLQSQIGGKKVQLNTWRKKHGTFTHCVSADASHHEITLKCLWLQTKVLSQSAVEHNCLLNISHIS